jgi:anaphase-promoting complex subunit 2
LTLPVGLADHFQAYENEYSKIKRGRRLTWLHQLGTVEVDIELVDRQISMEVTPLQATVLYAFEEHGRHRRSVTHSDQLDVDELCEITGSTAVSVRRAALFWVLQGVLKEITSDTFYVLEHAEEAPSNHGMCADI